MNTEPKFFVIPEKRQVKCLSPALFTVEFLETQNGCLIRGIKNINGANLGEYTAEFMSAAGDAWMRPVWKLLPEVEHLYRGCGRGWIRIDPSVPAIIDMAYADDFDNREKNQNVLCTDFEGYVIDDDGDIVAETPVPGANQGDKVYVNFSCGEACGF